MHIQDGSFKFSVANEGVNINFPSSRFQGHGGEQTFEMKEDIRLIILEHLSDKLDVHVLDVDFLY